MRKLLIFAFLALFPMLVLAQTAAEISEESNDDKGFLTNLLESKLSGVGRRILIDGFAGALSSRATFEKITIADEEGVWLTLEDGAIQWNRSALLRGSIEIAELSAKRVLLPRPPAAQQGDQPAAEAREFALPELPVSVNIEKIQADRVELGEPLIGLAASLSVAGSMSLAGGEGQANLTINRLDGPRGAFVLGAEYNNESKIFGVNLSLDEAKNGLLANLVGLYDKPAVNAQISGEGPLDGFAADVRLATNGQPRVTGRVSVAAEAAADGTPGRAFKLQLGGDVASLLPPDDRSFFGGDAQLSAEGWRGENGRLNIPTLKIDTDAMDIAGSVSTNNKGAPQSANLMIALGRDAGATVVPVKLPGAGPNDTVEAGKLQLHYDLIQGQGWTLNGNVTALHQDSVDIGALVLKGNGQVVLNDGGELSEISGKLTFGGDRLAFVDAGLAQAIGEKIDGSTRFVYGAGVLALTEIKADGSNYGLSGNATLSDLRGGLKIVTDLAARYEDLSRLSTLAGREVSGRADASVAGHYTVFTKAFDLKATVAGSDITIDQEQIDRLLAGRSQIVADASRDETGIKLRGLSVDAQQLTARARGFLNSDASDLTATISMPSLAELGGDYAGSLETNAKLTGAAGQRQLSLNGQAQDLKTGIQMLDRALQGETELTALAGEVEGGYELQQFHLDNPQLEAKAKGNFAAGALDATADFNVPALSVLNPDWDGDLTATAKLTEKDGIRFVDLTGVGNNLRLGNQSADGALTGVTNLRVQAEENAGVITLRDVKLDNNQINATASGVYGTGITDIAAKLDVSSLTPIGAGMHGAVRADASFKEDGQGGRRLELTGTGTDLGFGQSQLDSALAGETRFVVKGTERSGSFAIEEATIDNPTLNASAVGTVGGGKTDLDAKLNAGDLSFLGNGISGSVNAEARLMEENGVRQISAKGNANSLAMGQPQVDPVLKGQTSFDLAATQSDAGIALQRLLVDNPQLRVTADGNPAEALNINARLADLGIIRPEFPGPATAIGTVQQTADSFVVDLDLTAPGDTRVSVEGTAARNFSTSDLTITGNTNASIANSSLRTRSVEGPVNINLRVNGAPALEAVSGRVQLSGGNLSEPRMGIRLEALNLTADLQNGRIMVEGSGNVASGGSLSLSGPVDIRSGEIDMGVRLNNVVARDPNFYETVLSGDVRISGQQRSGLLVSGRIDVGETEIRIPSTGLGGARSIPDIQHLGDRRPVRATRARAGLEPYGSQAAQEAGLGGPAATPPAIPPRLDLLISAPRQIFIRGRGVDAELGGELAVQGTTRNVIPIGHLELIRGRVDLLGKRFDLTEGIIELQGSLIPVLRLVAETSQDDIVTQIIIDGEAMDPDIKFQSSPELPEEEVLSQLLFGRGLDNISPLQAAQLANAIAVLAGRAGEGIVSKLRNQVGLDDLDLATDDEGNVQVRAGKYLTDNVYTDVSVGDDGKTALNLNLDVSETIRGRGSVNSDGESTIGIFFERDY